MHRIRILASFPLLLVFAAVLSTAMINPARIGNGEQGAKLSFAETTDLTQRQSAIDAALAQPGLFDCSNYVPDKSPILPNERQVFRTIRDTKVTPDDGSEYLGAVWSPKGDAMVFTLPTHGRVDVTEHDTLPSDTKTVFTGIGTSRLALYHLSSNTWEQISSNGARPVWSADGSTIRYLSGLGLVAWDPKTRREDRTAFSTPATGVGLKFTQPLVDGGLLAPRSPHAPLEVLGSQSPRLGKISVTESDSVLVSPKADRAVVAYGANTYKGQFTPAVATLRDTNGQTMPLLLNCQYSATEMVWSPNGDRIAYPVHADRPEIRIYDVRSGQTQVLVRFGSLANFSGLTWSPDGRHLAFAFGEERTIWVVSTDGVYRQQLVKGGLLPNWSPDGRQILYARPGGTRILDWFILYVDPS